MVYIGANALLLCDPARVSRPVSDSKMAGLGLAALLLIERFAKGRAISDRARHLLDEYFLASSLFEAIPCLQRKVLVRERRNASRSREFLYPRSVKFALPSRPFEALLLVVG